MSLGGGVVTGDGHYNVRDCGEQKLKRMQKAALSGTFNIAWTFKVVT